MLNSYSNYLNSLLNNALQYFNYLSNIFYPQLVSRVEFLPTYYTRNENIWVDGFLFDFLQKKTADAWVRQYVIFTGFLFSERLVFESLIRLYLDTIIWPAHNFNIFESSNTSSMLNVTIFLYFSFFVFIIMATTFIL